MNFWEISIFLCEFCKTKQKAFKKCVNMTHTTLFDQNKLVFQKLDTILNPELVLKLPKILIIIYTLSCKLSGKTVKKVLKASFIDCIIARDFVMGWCKMVAQLFGPDSKYLEKGRCKVVQLWNTQDKNMFLAKTIRMR